MITIEPGGGFFPPTQPPTVGAPGGGLEPGGGFRTPEQPTPTAAPPQQPTPQPGHEPILNRRAYSTHITEDTAGGVASTEVRVIGPIVSPFRIADLVITGEPGAVPGQFIDILISANDDTTDTANPSGTSIFAAVRSQSSQPVPDGSPTLPVPAGVIKLTNIHQSPTGNAFIKIVASFTAPALSMPNVHVMLVIDEIEPASTTPTPRAPVPTDQPAPTPTPAPAPRIAADIPRIATPGPIVPPGPHITGYGVAPPSATMTADEYNRLIALIASETR